MPTLDFANMAEQVYRAIRRRIDDGQIPLGARLHIGRVAEELGVSATPVREALNRLTTEGMASWRPHVGIFVVNPSRQEIADLCRARLCLERGMAGEVIRHATDDQTAELRRYAGELGQALGGREWRPSSFHRLYATIAGNRVLAELHQKVNGPLNILFALAARAAGPEALAKHMEEEQAICRAVEGGDIVALVQALEAHIMSLETLLLEYAVPSRQTQTVE